MVNKDYQWQRAVCSGIFGSLTGFGIIIRIWRIKSESFEIQARSHITAGL